MILMVKIMNIENIIGNTYLVKGHTNVGIYKINDHDIYLIDTGFGIKFGKLLLNLLKENNFNVAAIINTHSHVDHIGGNKIIQDEFNCPIYIGGLEKGMIENTQIEPSALTGCLPNKFIKNYWFAENAVARDIKDFKGELEIIDLKGHSANMIGVKTKDDVVFLGDALVDTNKTKIGYIYDIAEYKKSLKKLKSLKASYYVFSHTEIYKNIKEIIDLNIKAVQDLEQFIINNVNNLCFEELLSKIFYNYNIEFNLIQYYIIGTTIKSYLSYLVDNDKIAINYNKNKLIYTVNTCE